MFSKKKTGNYRENTKIKSKAGVVALTFNPAIGGERQADFYELKTSLIYIAPSYKVRPCLKPQIKTNTEKLDIIL